MAEEQAQIDRITGIQGEVTTYLRDDMRDFFDHELKNSNYLLVAHGAGLIGCLSTLKDYAVTEQLKGIGVFISLFAIGFILAAMGTVALSINRIAMLTWVTHGGERPKLGFWSATLPLLLSIMCLFGAVLLIVFKFHSL